MKASSRVYVAGHLGLVGSALCRELDRRGYGCVITRARSEMDLTDAAAVKAFFAETRPEYVFLAAAKVGGIRANATYPADFLWENLQIQNNVLWAAHRFGVRKLLFLGSSCIYPRMAEQPMRESALLTGPLEPTNQWYAIAKIAGIQLCQAFRRQHGCDFISVMPTNLYGPNDDYDLETSHVVPAMIRRFHEARRAGQPEVVLWGTGTPRRELLHADDLARACLFLMDAYSDEEIINAGSGEEVTIRELAERVARTVGYGGRIAWDPTRPDGTPRKLMNSDRIRALGWRPEIGLEEGLARTYRAYLEQLSPAG